MEQHVVISYFFLCGPSSIFVSIYLRPCSLKIFIEHLSYLFISPLTNHKCVNVQNFIHCLCRSLLLLIVCTTLNVHKHTYSHAFCFPFVCAVIRALCAMGASFHAKYTFQIVVCLCCLSIFFERWRVLSTIETCVYIWIVYKRKSDLFAMKRHRFQPSIYNIFIRIYIYFTNGTNENNAILIFPHFMHSSQCCAYMISSVHNEFNSISFDFESEYMR